MGYYDDHYGQYRQGQKNRRGWFLSAFVGAILGALLVLISIPALSDILPYDIASENGQVQNGETKQHRRYNKTFRSM